MYADAYRAGAHACAAGRRGRAARINAPPRLLPTPYPAARLVETTYPPTYRREPRLPYP